MAAPIVLELAVAMWRWRRAPDPARKLVWLAAIQVAIPLTVYALLCLEGLRHRGRDDYFINPWGMIGMGFYAFSWLVTTVLGLCLIEETQQSHSGDRDNAPPDA